MSAPAAPFRQYNAQKTKEVNNKNKFLRELTELLRRHEKSLLDMMNEVFDPKKTTNAVFSMLPDFYRMDGPKTVIEKWSLKLNSQPANSSFIEACTKITADAAKEELLKMDTTELQLPPANVTLDTFENFSLAPIARALDNAPTLQTILVGLTSVNQKSNRDSNTVHLVIGAILIFLRSRSSNYYQKMMGLFLFSTGTSRKAIEVLSALGLTVSYDTILHGTEDMTADALKRIREAVLQRAWSLVYDNLNFYRQTADQRRGNAYKNENMTTVSVVMSEEISKDGIIDKDPYQKITSADLQITKGNNDHFLRVYRHQITMALKRNNNDFKDCPSPPPTLMELEVKKTIIHPLPILDIDESSVDGNKSVIDYVMLKEFVLKEDYFDDPKLVYVAGDQLTVSRLATLKRYSRDEVSDYYKREWLLPIFQLFHLQMAFSGLIIKNYFGQNDGIPGTMEYNASYLKRKGITYDKQDFHAADELIRHSFDALVLRASDVIVNSVESTLEDQGLSGPSTRLTCIVDGIVNKYHKGSVDLNYKKESKNAVLFIRDAALYIELSDAIKAGDIGRLEEVLLWLTIMFQAGGTKNYANELLRLHCNFRYAWTPELKRAVVSSWLVNTSGKPNGWIPLDLYQEHNNLLIKVIYAAKGCNVSLKTMQQRISTNIRTFGVIISKMTEIFNTRQGGSEHSTVSAEDDIKSLVTALEGHGILSDVTEHILPIATPGVRVRGVRVRGGRAKATTQTGKLKETKDLFLEGTEKITGSKRLDDFKKRNKCLSFDSETDAIEEAFDETFDVDPSTYIEDYIIEY